MFFGRYGLGFNYGHGQVPRCLIESLVKLLSSWSAHTHVEVRQWVRDKLTEIADQIEHEQRRDDERLIRFS